METILQLKNINKSYQQQYAVKDVSFYINKGEAYGLLGPNGAGKSTTINIIAGILEADAGEVTIDSYSIKKERKKAQGLIGVVPQEIALYHSMSAEANLRFFGKLYGISGNKLTETVENTLKLVGLYERRSQPVEKYSGGMKRRINIAAALLHQPKLLIMDEPTVGIDPQSRSHILDTIKKLKQEQGISILYTSHYIEEVEALCDRVGIIDNGKLIADGTISELKAKQENKTQIKISVKEPIKMKENIKLLKEKLNLSIEENAENLIIYSESTHKLPEILTLFQQIDCEIRSLEIQEPSLETIFLSLTGKSLRDE